LSLSLVQGQGLDGLADGGFLFAFNNDIANLARFDDSAFDQFADQISVLLFVFLRQGGGVRADADNDIVLAGGGVDLQADGHFGH